ncbi:hypothetical protein [Liquorilactobacillus oeni]|nr:hypothetical protein [Liquorilactobacillus oeni]
MTALPTIAMTIVTNHLQNWLNNFKWQQTPSSMIGVLKHETII